MNTQAYITTSRSAYRSDAYTGSRPAGGSAAYVRRSFPGTHKSFVTPTGTGHPMQYGDRVYVRLIVGGAVAVDFTTCCANDLTELLGMVRVQTRGRHGLGRLYVRNMSRGWSIDRPLMLYSALSPRMGGCPAPAAAPARQIMPWETH